MILYVHGEWCAVVVKAAIGRYIAKLRLPFLDPIALMLGLESFRVICKSNQGHQSST